MKKYKALILGGGGSTGEFQIGALPVICSHYDHIDSFVGVGVGSLHATVLAQYDSLHEGTKVLMQLWNNIKKTSDILSAPLGGADLGTLLALASDKSWARDGAFTNKRLKKIINEYVSWDQLKDKKNWAIRLSSLSDGRLYTVSNQQALLDQVNHDGHHIQFSTNPLDQFYVGDQITDIIAAAGSVPLMLPPVDIFGHRFVEGGLRDFTPLELAVRAFQLHEHRDQFDEAEFIVIDNYRHEVEFENSDLLDSGNEIILRAIKIMTVEMAQNDILIGKKMLDELAIPTTLITMRPQTDFRLHPMNFDDLDKRKKQRRHGAERALIELKANNVNSEEAIQRIITAVKQNQASEDQIEELMAQAVRNPSLVGTILDPTITLEPRDDEANRYHRLDEDQIMSPDSLLQLKASLIAAVHRGDKNKAVGSGYAFSNILETSGIQIRLNKLKNIFSPSHKYLKDNVKINEHIEFEAGATIQDLNQKLLPIRRTILNQPGYEHLNYFGVCTTGGHGSGIRLGPIANAIRSLHLITLDEQEQIKEYRIEPSNGISDRNKHVIRTPHIELIQDDDTFNSVIVSNGTFGLVYSLIIKTQDSFFLKEKREMTDWDSIKGSVMDTVRDPKNHSVHIWVNPYQVKNKTRVVLTEYTGDPGPPRGKRPWGTSWYGVDEVSPILNFITNAFRKEIPKILNASLKQVVNKTPVVMLNPQALNFGSPNHAIVHATNFSIPANRAVEFVKAFQNLCLGLKSNHQYVTAPIGLRFTSPGNGLISPQFGRESCMVEVPILKNTKNAVETIDAIQKMAFQHFEGRPHWGQINRLMQKDLFKQMFPKWKVFIENFERFNKGHFDNAFTKQLGWRELANEMAQQEPQPAAPVPVANP